MLGAHGGRVEALTRARGGIGTTIRVTLPLPDADAQVAAGAALTTRANYGL
jgi:hypothetical protein